jgi:hypothetical protein
VPYADGHILSQLREAGIVRKEEYTAEGVRVCASADLGTISRLDAYVTELVPRERVFQWRREQALAELAAAGATMRDEDEAHVAELHSVVR